MTRLGRPAKTKGEPYVLTHEEVVRLYFRRSPLSMTPQALAAEEPTFPRPNRAGLYHRGAVEAWVDLDHGVKAQSGPVNYTALAEERLRGRRQDTLPQG